MATAHLLANPSAAASCLAALAPGDSLLLIADGTFARLAPAPPGVRLGALREDAEQRGVAPPDGFRTLSYADFVAWVVGCERSVTWS